MSEHGPRRKQHCLAAVVHHVGYADRGTRYPRVWSQSAEIRIEAHVMVASLGAGEWTVLERDPGEVVDKNVRGERGAGQRVFEEPANRELAAHGSTLCVRGGQHHAVVSGSLEVLDSEHEQAFLRRSQS